MSPITMPYTPVILQQDLYVIIPAAGLGTRMGLSDSKQFLEIAGIPVLARTLLAFSKFQETFRKKVHAIVVTGPENIERVFALCEEYKCDFVEKIIPGGETRQDSVACGIRALSELARPPIEIDIVFIHDGARCLIDEDTLEKCFLGGVAYDVCVTGTPCKNTIKSIVPTEVSGEESSPIVGTDAPLVDRTLDRALLYEVQTPQVFKYSVLQNVSERAAAIGLQATDDTALAESLGIAVHVIPGSYRNIKITTPEDAVIAEYFLS